MNDDTIMTRAIYDGSVYMLTKRDGYDVTLRDQFAMAALTSMLSPTQDITPSTPAYAAELSYKFADAMMEARK